MNGCNTQDWSSPQESVTSKLEFRSVTRVPPNGKPNVPETFLSRSIGNVGVVWLMTVPIAVSAPWTVTVAEASPATASPSTS